MTTTQPAPDGSGDRRQDQRKPRFGQRSWIWVGLVPLVVGGIAGLILCGCSGCSGISSTSVGDGTNTSNGMKSSGVDYGTSPSNVVKTFHINCPNPSNLGSDTVVCLEGDVTRSDCVSGHRGRRGIHLINRRAGGPPLSGQVLSVL